MRPTARQEPRLTPITAHSKMPRRDEEHCPLTASCGLIPPTRNKDIRGPGGRTNPSAAAQWLAQAATEPDRLLALWDRCPQQPAPVPAGVTFDAVATRTDLGEALIECNTAGPVLLNRTEGLHFYFVPRGSLVSMRSLEAQVVPDGTLLLAPMPGTSGDANGSWLCPPDGTGRLVDPELLHTAIRAALPGFVARAEARLEAALITFWESLT